MPRRIVDISVALKAGIKSDPPWALPQIDYHDHQMTAPPIAEYFGIRQDQLPEGNYAAREQARLSTMPAPISTARIISTRARTKRWCPAAGLRCGSTRCRSTGVSSPG